jgi:hypothetical protein
VEEKGGEEESGSITAAIECDRQREAAIEAADGKSRNSGGVFRSPGEQGV